MIGVLISTYQRPDGKTPFYLRRAINSIMAQHNKDYKVLVIGDNYSDQAEFNKLQKHFTKVEFINLPGPTERDKYTFGDYRLFCAGGVRAVNYGIELLLVAGCEYICHMDHDDYWTRIHLTYINEAIQFNPLFICTLSSYYGSWLPKYPRTNEILDYMPSPGCCCFSSSCIKYSDTEVRVRDCFAEIGKVFPADADLWLRLAEDMIKKNKKGSLITAVTCHHDEEGYSFRGDFK